MTNPLQNFIVGVRRDTHRQGTETYSVGARTARQAINHLKDHIGKQHVFNCRHIAVAPSTVLAEGDIIKHGLTVNPVPKFKVDTPSKTSR